MNRHRIFLWTIHGPRADGVIIDLSYGAAQALRFVNAGRAPVRIEVLRWGT